MRSPSYEPAHCIVCGHADSSLVADAEAIRGEVESLWAFHERRLKPSIPVSHLRDRVAFSQHPPYRLVACRECGLVYRNPSERAFELESTYARDCPPREVLQALHDIQRSAYRDQARRLRAMLAPGTTVLEVGSYVGAFLATAREAGLSASGVDINPAVNKFTRSLGFQVHDGELSNVDAEPVAAVAIWNTFDQLLDPRATAIAAYSRLRPGGVLALRVPNGAFYRHWRSRAPSGFGRAMLAHNNLLTFPYRWGFNPWALAKLLDGIGFRTVVVVGDVLVPTADEWTRPWARIEERLIKGMFRVFSGAASQFSPWFEIYATRSS